MFKKAIFLFLSFFTFSSYSFLTNLPELRRQYQDYLRIFDKTETSYGFETFVENLNKGVPGVITKCYRK